VKKKTGPIMKMKRVDLPDSLILWDVDSLDTLLDFREKDEMLLETDSDFFLLKREGLLRYSKPEGRPHIIRIERLSLNMDKSDGEVLLSQEELLNFAKQMRLIVFETDDEYLIPSSTFFRARKEKQKCSR